MRRHAIRNVVAALAVLGVGLAACSSDKKATPTTTAAPTTAPEGTTGGTAGPTTSAGPKPASGDPIKIAYIWSGNPGGVNLPNGRDGALAAIEYINQELGGLQGRPIQQIDCPVMGTPESSVSCANQVIDAKPVVVWKQNDNGSAASIPIYKASGIPYYTPSGAGVLETTTDGVFNNSPGTTAIWASIAKFASDQKIDKIGVVALNVAPVTDSYAKFGKAVFEKLNIQITFVTFDAAAADLSPMMQTASAGAKFVFVLGSPAQCVAAGKAWKSLGLTVPVMVPGLCWDPTTMDAFGGAKGAYIVADESTNLAEDPDVKIFTAAMKKYKPDTKVDGAAATGFLGMINLYRVLKQIPAGTAIDKVSAMAAFRATKDLPLFMKHGGTMTCDAKQITGLISICNASYYVAQWDGTKMTVLVDVNVPAVLKAAGL